MWWGWWVRVGGSGGEGQMWWVSRGGWRLSLYDGGQEGTTKHDKSQWYLVSVCSSVGLPRKEASQKRTRQRGEEAVHLAITSSLTTSHAISFLLWPHQVNRLLSAAEAGDINLIRYLLDWGEKPSSETQPQLCHPVCQCKKCLPYTEVNLCSSAKNTLLHGHSSCQRVCFHIFSLGSVKCEFARLRGHDGTPQGLPAWACKTGKGAGGAWSCDRCSNLSQTLSSTALFLYLQ